MAQQKVAERSESSASTTICDEGGGGGGSATTITTAPPCFPMRFQIVTIMFAAITVSFLLRSSISMNILAMVQPLDETVVDVPDFGPRYHWSALQQSILLASSFAGATVTIIPLGILLNRFGHVRQSVLASFVISAFLQLAGPWAAEHSFEALVAIVLAGGLVQGGIIIAAHAMFTTWAPPAELGIFTCAIMGTNLGTIVSWTASGTLIERFGWAASFYFNAALAALFAGVWAWVAYDSPAKHPRCGKAEREMIEGSLADVHHVQGWPPIWAIVTSWPAWSLLLLQFGNLWGLFFLLTAAPKFVNEILGFQLAGTGVLASAPYLARWLASFGWAVLGKRMLLGSGWQLVNVRRFFCVFSHLLPGLCFIAVPYVSTTPYACIAIVALSQALNGAAPQSTFATFHDIAPNYAVTMVSIINTCGSMSALLAPLLVAYETAASGNTIEAWRRVFAFGATVYIVPALLFCVAGSASVQRWDSGEQQRSKGGEGDGGKEEGIVKGAEVAVGRHVASTAEEGKGEVRGVMYGPLYGM